ncbi:MAG TPA: hypothetical protein VFV07_06475 [Rhizomicrobium sp.]|nr:hypothetical protein [Rhizomicrobium sp.]
MDESVAVPAPTPPLQFEQLLFARSPFGLVATAALMFALMFGSFLAIADLEHVAAFQRAGGIVVLTDAGWPALVLSLLCTAALAMQRYARVAEAKDAPAYAKILTGGMASALNVTGATPTEARFGRATLLGLGSGLVIAAIVRVSEMREGHLIPPVTMAWYASATVLLMVLFMRGAEQTRAGNRSYARVLNAELKIDLLRTDQLAVLGRSAARTALIWFVISAIACLFFINGELNWLTILLIVSCAAMGGGIFVSIMSRIHKQILSVKSSELEHIRCQVEAMRAAMHDDAQAAQRLHGLLAYEKRIADAPEWPFDQTTLVRVVASAFLLTVPWFGQAVAAFVVERLAQFAK